MPGWERLRHGGLLLDAARLAALSQNVPGPLDDRIERQLRRRAGAMSEAGGDGRAVSVFVAFVLEEVCGLDASTGDWTRGNHVSPSWGRRAITGETVKPRHLWTGRAGGRLTVFLDDGRRLGVGRGRRIVSQVLDWLRAGALPAGAGRFPSPGPASALGPDDQVRLGLPWVATLVAADPIRIASGTYALPTWLIDMRSVAVDTGLLTTWQRVVNDLVVAGDTRLAPYSD